MNLPFGFFGEYEDVHAFYAGAYAALRLKRPSLPDLENSWSEEEKKNLVKRRHYYTLGYSVMIALYSFAVVAGVKYGMNTL